VLQALLAASTGRGEFAALIDTKDAFDACSAASRGVDLSKLIWVRCGGNAEHALRAADLLIQAGGFGVVALDLAEAAPAALNRIPPHRLVPLPAGAGFDAHDPDRGGRLSSGEILFVTDYQDAARRAAFTGRAPFLLLRDAG